ncbi:MAG: molybdopterin-dependent oxidoreductase [Nitrospina sp.]|jgi:formate dehydrogenase (NADP+) alpha subunit|nr:molybdopterin-dependent oxidoreductase [Nitrospina sp.]MBT4389085.1 molybdopterin-dependent oxidoreductase [Nitrospina sp.]MBT4621369.1 molybdopterin-dependent oxidoreductase [Nitrospina sp.]MBT4900196.1 molybdopterin-dependent oxidoreductase [Nitrospina sp.]MBT5762390.1 molybdopterin-dependent oxidoreductase [Nitrospina sp.]
MSTVTKKACNIKINGKAASVPEGTVILEACKQNDVPVSNLCYNRKLVPFAACRTCMIETVVDGKKELVYSCTQPVAEGMEIRTGTEETDRYNKACLEMLLVEHPLDCPICDKSGVCPLQDNTDMLQMFDGRFEIQRRNEPSIKTNPIIEFYLNRCIMCGLCVRACDEIQGVQALDFHKRGMSVKIGTANDEPLDCEFCGQCITVCPTGALMDMTSSARGLAALFTETHTTCNYCSWGCTIKLESKKGQVVRIEADENYDVGINEGNLCAKGRLGHGIIHNDQRIESPLMNVGGSYKEVTWEEALQAIADRMQTTVNRSGPDSLAGISSEKLTNEESYLFQKLFRSLLGSNQVTNLANARAPYLNAFMLNCFENGIVSQPITKLQEADVALVFNSDLPSEYPVGGNSIRFGTVFSETDLLIANPRKVVFDSRAKIDVRMTYKHGSDLAVASRLARIMIDNNLVDVGKAKSAIPNYNDWVQSLAPYTAQAVEQSTGISDDVLTRAAERFARDADRFVIVGNDILDTNEGEEILNALLNLCTLVQHGSTGSVSIYPPREHCNSQGVNDMGCTPEFLPGYQPAKDSSGDLFQNCVDGTLKFLYIAGEDPIQSYYKPQVVKEALRTVPFLVVSDIFMTDTARMADLILPSSTFAEKDGTYTNMSRHVQRVAAAVIPQGLSKPDFDILIELAEALGKPFENTDIASVQQEIGSVAPIYKGVFPGDKSVQWKPASTNANPQFRINGTSTGQNGASGYPFTLQTNNHMFHIGSYSQYAKALVDIGPECIAELHPDDAKELKISTGDNIVVESPEGKVEVKVKTSRVTSRGMLYIPKNWTTVPVNALRNGEEGLINVKISKASG